MKITKRVKEQIKSQPKKVKEVPNEIINTIGAYCLENELHIKTIYQLCKVPHIDQMLDTMYETTIKEYKLHIPTLERIKDSNIRNNINRIINKHKIQIPVIGE